jgi:hypothetical protein
MPRNYKGYTEKGGIKPGIGSIQFKREKGGKKSFQDHLMYRVVLRE